MGKDGYDKRARKKRIKESEKELIENVEVIETRIKSKGTAAPVDVRVSVPYKLATKLNQDTNLRKSQNNIRKQFATFIENNFDDLVDCYDKISDPLIKTRIILEVAKLVIPRPKEYENGEGESDERNKIISRMFGKSI